MSNLIGEVKNSDLLSSFTDEEKKKLRRQRFIFDSGNTIDAIKITEEEKVKMEEREKRFGVIEKDDTDIKLKKRRERFGENDMEKLQKRKERFNLEGDDDKLKKRAERFNLNEIDQITDFQRQNNKFGKIRNRRQRINKFPKY